MTILDSSTSQDNPQDTYQPTSSQFSITSTRQYPYINEKFQLSWLDVYLTSEHYADHYVISEDEKPAATAFEIGGVHNVVTIPYGEGDVLVAEGEPFARYDYTHIKSRPVAIWIKDLIVADDGGASDYDEICILSVPKWLGDNTWIQLYIWELAGKLPHFLGYIDVFMDSHGVHEVYGHTDLRRDRYLAITNYTMGVLTSIDEDDYKKAFYDANDLSYEWYIKSPWWQTIRKAALDRAKNLCQLCNAAGNLHAHHRTYARLGAERLEDLTVLCKTCHDNFHKSGVQLSASIDEIPF